MLHELVWVFQKPGQDEQRERQLALSFRIPWFRLAPRQARYVLK
jgi:hypothetical protein